MPVSMLVRCEKCGYENFPQHRFCGMCAAELRLPGPGGGQPVPGPTRSSAPQVSIPPVSSRTVSANPAPPPRPAPPLRKDEGIAENVSGPSFLGLGSEPADSRNLSYLLEDETPQHRGRNLILFLLLVGAGVAAWHWRQDLRVIAGRLLSSPPPISTASGNAAPDANSTAPAGSPPDATPANGASPTNHIEQPAQGTATQTSDQPPAPQAQVPPAAPASGTPDSTQASQTSQSQPNPLQTDQSQPSDQPPSTNSAPDSAAVKPDTGDSGPPVQAQPARKSARAQTKPAVEDMEAEGEKYLYGNGVPENCTRARTTLLAAAQRSSAQAESVLGTMYATGHCATRDLPTAYRWFSRSLSKDPNNTRIEQDLKVLWNQMTPEEKQLALRDVR